MPIMDENDVSLPKATLSKMIREFMPSEVRLAGDAMDMIIECCTEFVSLVSSESNDVSNREKRNTIHPDHVLKALQELGLQEFVREVTSTWDTWKEESKCRPTGAHKPGNRKTAADVAGLSEEEQIALQQQLFAAARRSFQLPDLRTESGPSTGVASAVPNPVGGEQPVVNQDQMWYGNQTSGAGSNVGPNPGYLAQHLGMPPSNTSGASHLPQFQAPPTSQHEGQHPLPLGYAGSGSNVVAGYSDKSNVLSEANRSRSMAPYPLYTSPPKSSTCASSGGYGSDVLPIPPLQAQPIPSAFHPTSGPSLSGPSLATLSRPQSNVLNQGVVQTAAPNTQQCMFLVQPGTLVSQAGSAAANPGVQTMWAPGIPQLLPEVHLSQPVMVIHNGVQHLIPLQTLLSQVGGIQQFRVGPANQPGSDSGPMNKSGTAGGAEGSTSQGQVAPEIKEEHHPTRLVPGLTQPSLGLEAGVLQKGGEPQPHFGGVRMVEATGGPDHHTMGGHEVLGVPDSHLPEASRGFAVPGAVLDPLNSKPTVEHLHQPDTSMKGVVHQTRLEHHLPVMRPSMPGSSAMLSPEPTALGPPPHILQPHPMIMQPELGAPPHMRPPEVRPPEATVVDPRSQVSGSNHPNPVAVPLARPSLEGEETTKGMEPTGGLEKTEESQSHAPNPAPTGVPMVDPADASDPSQGVRKRERQKWGTSEDVGEDEPSPFRKKDPLRSDAVYCEPTG